MGDSSKLSCFIYKRGGDVEVIESTRAPAAEPPNIPSVAGLVPVTDIMSRNVICALSDVAIDTVVDLLVTKYIGCVPIVDGDGCPIGMITKRDVIESMVNPAPASTAHEVMLPIAFSLGERQTVAQAAALMATEDLHHAPIISAKGRLVGIVSSLDIVRWLARNDGIA